MDSASEDSINSGLKILGRSSENSKMQYFNLLQAEHYTESTEKSDMQAHPTMASHQLTDPPVSLQPSLLEPWSPRSLVSVVRPMRGASVLNMYIHTFFLLVIIPYTVQYNNYL
jgi:hypothetical protein